MLVTQKMEMDLDRADLDIRIYAVQGDRFSRAICFLLQENGLKWQIPDDFRLVVHYVRADGTGGLYDMLDDDQPAWEARGNALTVYLAPQVMAVAGDVTVQLGMYSGKSVLHSFRFTVEVSQVLERTETVMESNRWIGSYFPQLTGAEPGQLVQIEEVDGLGHVIRARGIQLQTEDAGSSASSAKPLQYKTIVCFGDDMFARRRDLTSVSMALARSTGAQVYNVGFEKSWMCANDGPERAPFSAWALANALCTRDFSWQERMAAQGTEADREQLTTLRGINPDQVDAVIFHFGAEDFFAGAPLDEGDEDYSSLCGALRYSITKLLTNYPRLRIFVSLPLFCTMENSDGTVSGSDEYRNSAGQTLKEFAEAIRETAKAYHMPVIDGYHELGINLTNAGEFLTDGFHLNEVGRARMGKFLGANLIGCMGI